MDVTLLLDANMQRSCALGPLRNAHEAITRDTRHTIAGMLCRALLGMSRKNSFRKQLLKLEIRVSVRAMVWKCGDTNRRNVLGIVFVPIIQVLLSEEFRVSGAYPSGNSVAAIPISS
tara:strand:+ start:69 stop:419 length:351 start_codon:yes stop_codon:yes gene_type:complete